MRKDEKSFAMRFTEGEKDEKNPSVCACVRACARAYARVLVCTIEYVEKNFKFRSYKSFP